MPQLQEGGAPVHAVQRRGDISEAVGAVSGFREPAQLLRGVFLQEAAHDGCGPLRIVHMQKGLHVLKTDPGQGLGNEESPVGAEAADDGFRGGDAHMGVSRADVSHGVSLLVTQSCAGRTRSRLLQKISSRSAFP